MCPRNNSNLLNRKGDGGGSGATPGFNDPSYPLVPGIPTPPTQTLTAVDPTPVNQMYIPTRPRWGNEQGPGALSSDKDETGNKGLRNRRRGRGSLRIKLNAAPRNALAGLNIPV